jgi:hypothetical protein
MSFPQRVLAAIRESHSLKRMSTLTEIEMAIPHLDVAELSRLEKLVHSLRFRREQPMRRSAFDLAAWEASQASDHRGRPAGGDAQ